MDALDKLVEAIGVASLAIILAVQAPQSLGQEEAPAGNTEAEDELSKKEPVPLKESPRFRVKLEFPHDSVESVLNIYDRLIEKEVERDSSLSDGPKIALVSPVGVSREGAISLIEAALLVNGYVIEETTSGKVTVRFDASRQGRWVLGAAEGDPASEPPKPRPKPNGPSKEDVAKYKSLSEEERSELRDFVSNLMKTQPNMSREERGKLIRDEMNRLVNSEEKSDSSE